MKGYVKYFILFIILLLIGVTSVTLYSNNRLDTKNKTKDPTTTETSNEKTDASDKTETSNEKEPVSPKEDTPSDHTSNVTEANGTTNSDKTSASTTPPSNNSSSNNSSSNNSTSTSNNQKVENKPAPPTTPVKDDYITIEVDNNVYQNNSKNDVSQDSSANSVLSQEENIIIISKPTPPSSNSTNDQTTTNNPTDNNNSTTSNPINNNATNNNPSNDNTINDNSEIILSQEVIAQMKEAEKEALETKEKLEEIIKNESQKKEQLKDGNVIGATGYTALNGKKFLRTKPSNQSTAIMALQLGVPFKILAKNSNDTWWKVQYNGKIGYVENAYCLINLPDYIPSIHYIITNASKSIYKSSGQKLSVTGQKLYTTGKVYNERLEKKQYIVPVVYSFGKKILIAQTQALKEGYSLKIYDAYRPVSAAKQVKNSLTNLYNNNSKVRNNINYASNGTYWGQGWFIANNLSAHSLASAIDVSLTKKGEILAIKMPTAVHELSTAAVKYKTPVSGQTIVRNDLYTSTMTIGAKKLDRIMLNAGLTNLSSEWWHFQDNTAYNRIKAYEPKGLDFQPTKIASSK